MMPLRVDVNLDRGRFALDAAFETAALVTGVFGHSGAGKSTLMNLIAGLEQPGRGRIALGDEALIDVQHGVRVPAHRRGVGVVFQEHRLFPHLTVTGNLRYGWRRCASNRRRFDFDTIVNLLELTELLNRHIDRLSGGERQRIALGRALLSSPRLLLLDEPLSSLDQRLKQQIIPFLVRVRDELKLPMLYVSHDLAEILQLTDHLVVLRDGRVAGAGAYQDLIAGDSESTVFEDDDVVNVLTLQIEGHRPHESNTMLRITGTDDADSGARIIGPPAPGEPGASIVATIDPSDIALATGPVPAVSIQNQVHGTVTRVSLRTGCALVAVDIGCPILARLSHRSVGSLGIAAGRPIVCLFKSNAIRYRMPAIA